jgi:hypothetical protein
VSRLLGPWVLLAFGCKEPPAEPEPRLWNGCVTFDLVPAVKGCWVNYSIDDGVGGQGGGKTWVTEDGVSRVCVEYREQHAPPRFIAGWGLPDATLYEFETEVYQAGTPVCGRDPCVHLGELPCDAKCYGGPEMGVPCTEVPCCLDTLQCMPDGRCSSTVTGD